MNRKLISMIALAAAFAATTTAAGAATLAGKVTVAGARNNANAVVWVAGAGSESASGKTAVIDQKSLTFSPFVLPVQVGTTVEFLNSDSVSHNVFTPDKCAGAFNLGTWAKGQKRTHTFDKPCMAVMLCAIHPEMEAWVVAVPSAYFAVTDAAGAFEIDGVPEGSHEVKAWDPKGHETSREVSITGDTEVELTLGG